MHKDACACQRDRAVDPAGFPASPLFRIAHVGMSDGLTSTCKPLKRDLDDNNNNGSNNKVPAKYQVLLPNWDTMNAMNGNLHLEASDARGVAMETSCKTSLLNEQMLEQLNGMSLTERRLPGGFAPRITLTSVDGDDERSPDGMADIAVDEYGLGPAPKFLTVPKLQEVGKERRPPVMVKTV